MKKTPLPVIHLDHYPKKGENISGYGVVEDEQNVGQHTCQCFVLIDGKTMIVDYTSSQYTVYYSHCSKKTYFAKIKETPEVGNYYQMERYLAFDSVSLWNLEKVRSGKLIGIKKLWENFYYAESENSAYFLTVEYVE